MLICSHSGIRGRAPEELTPDIARRAALAFAEIVGARRLVLARDTRPSGEILAKAVVEGLSSAGVDVIDLGIMPTPVAFFAVRELGADGAIVITGSHNPPGWNALKFAEGDGTFIRPTRMREVVQLMQAERSPRASARRGEVRRAEVTDAYISALLDELDPEPVRRARPRVLVDPGAGAAIKVSAKLLKAAGCKVRMVNDDPGRPARPYEPSASALAYLAPIVRGAYDIALAYDCDADRLVLVDERGRAADPNVTLLIAAMEHTRLHGSGKVVVNFATSDLVVNRLREEGCEVVYSGIGEVKVLEEMMRRGAWIGGEGSSAGVIWRRVNPTRDGILASLAILRYLAEQKVSLAEFVDSLPRRYGFHVKVPAEGADRERLLELIREEARSRGLSFEELDGIKIRLEGGWVLLRPSGTEPLVRVLGEAEDPAEAEEYMRLGVEIVRGALGEHGRINPRGARS